MLFIFTIFLLMNKQLVVDLTVNNFYTSRSWTYITCNGKCTTIEIQALSGRPLIKHHKNWYG